MPVTLAQALRNRRATGRAGFVPFIVAGDGNSLKIAKELVDAGADILELGVPFSDPVADGPAIQAAGQRALAKGMTLKKAAGIVRNLRMAGVRIPVVLFTYLNPILRMGVKKYAKLCGDCGVTATLIVDLPIEESTATEEALKMCGVELVPLASPTTTDRRLSRIGRASGTAVYYVSREGVTGVRKGLAPNIAKRILHVKKMTNKPVMVGFGVAEPAQAKALSRCADGVVVGSALVLAGSAAGALAKRIVKALEI